MARTVDSGGTRGLDSTGGADGAGSTGDADGTDGTAWKAVIYRRGDVVFACGAYGINVVDMKT